MQKLPVREIGERLRRAPRAVLFLDYDGTLAPIVGKPHEAKMSKSTCALVRRIAKKYRTYIVTGRALADIMKRARFPHMQYAGTHGFEWTCGKKRCTALLTKRQAAAIREAHDALAPLTQRYRGTSLEDKGIAIAFHYRALGKHGSTAKRAALALLARLPSKHHFHIVESKMALDVRPEGRTKGDFASDVMKRMPNKTLAVYIGDDRTDEDAFRALKRHITVRVGKKSESAAKYYLASRDGVDSLLSELSHT